MRCYVHASVGVGEWYVERVEKGCLLSPLLFDLVVKYVSILVC